MNPPTTPSPVLDEQTLTKLGFKKVVPMGNSGSVWWGHPVHGSFTYTPTVEQFFSMLLRRGQDQGRREVQTAIKEALNIF